MAEDYVMQQGDCISSIAYERGFFWETIYYHPNNADFRAKRPDPNIAKEGDVVHIPDKIPEEVPRATDKRHRFKLKGAPAKLRLRIMEEPEPSPPPPAASASAPAQGSGGSLLDNAVSAAKQAMSIPGSQNPRESVTEDPATDPRPQPDRPRANVPFLIKIDGALFRGQTDGEGRIEIATPPNARQGQLILEPGTLNELELPLNLGFLNPLKDSRGATDVSGVKHRLANLGFDCGDRSDETTPELAAALRAFQEKHGLQATGEVDEATRGKILELH